MIKKIKNHFLIEVTAEDIANAGSSEYSCPIAQATEASTVGANARYHQIYFPYDGKQYYCIPSRRAKTFMHKYDKNGKKAVKPTKFKLEIKTSW